MTLNTTIQKLSAESSEEQIAAVIEQIKQSATHPDRLLKLLDYSNPVYANRSTNEVIRIRGYLLASFEYTGLSDRALPYVLEELDSSNKAYIVAGAAIALRGLKHPSPWLTTYLFKAVERMWHADDALSFETYKPDWPRATYTSALLELFKTIQWLKGKACDALETLKLYFNDSRFSPQVRIVIGQAIKAIEENPVQDTEVCCTDLPSGNTYRGNARKKDLSKIRLQDQDSRTIGYNEFFSGKPSIVVLFYTRCNNPFRCSLNMTRLGQLQQALKNENLSGEINLAAITYDPAYDYPERIRAYSNYRGFITDDHNRCFRVEEGMDILLSHLKAGVNYNGSFVNHHATEFWLLNAQGMFDQKFTGTQWDIPTIIRELNIVRTKKRSSLFSQWNNFSSALFSFLLVFFPKCPFCAAAYLSLLGITNLQFFALRVWLIPILVLLLAVNLFALFRMGKRRNWQLPFYISLSGAVCVVLATFLNMPTAYLGMGLIIAGSLLNALPKKLLLLCQPKLKL